MTKKYSLIEINKEFEKFSETTYQHFGSYSYATGALQGLVSSLLADAPAHKQEEVLKTIKSLTEKYSKEKVAV
jgi:hypothetical protein